MISPYLRPDSSKAQARVRVPAADGSRIPLVRSLGTSDGFRAAAVASSLQSLADGLPGADWLRTKRLVEDVFVAAGLPIPVIMRETLPVLRMIVPFAEDYLSRRKAKVTAAHFDLMKRCVMGFARAHATLELPHFKGLHIQAWLDGLCTDGLSVGSVRNQLSAVSSMFAYAVKMGVLSVNPCAGVDVPDAMPAVLRQPMAESDVERLKHYLRRTSKDWLVVTMLMRHAGLRLADAAKVEAGQVGFQDGCCLLDVTPGKTERTEVLPVFEPLTSFLRAAARVPGPLAPSLAALSPSALSKRFAALCDAAGIDPQIVTLPNKRTHRRVSAHSLRHSFVTDLVKRGIPEALRMKLSAHVTRESHAVYNHAAGMDLHKQLLPFFK